MIIAKKSLGQNFLTDRNILEKIVNVIDIKNKIILEVGPGTGNLTSFILKQKPKKVFVIEKDDDLAKNLNEKFGEQLTIINDDILNIDENTLSDDKVTVFGNLPYNISTEILSKWIINLKDDFITEGIESFYVEFRYTSSMNVILATSPTITINDSSRSPGSSATGFTFGPVIVNRDGGTAANATDWYKICKIDDLPEGSSIALFIDASGSMTLQTVRASYDAFVAKLNEKNITITTVTNSAEDWITPFLVDLP